MPKVRDAFVRGSFAWLLTISTCLPNRTKIKSRSKVGSLSRSIRGTAVRG
jgi:hypothetical protein